MRITPKTELDQRMEKIQLQLQQNGLDAAMLLQNADLFYFTGSIQQGVLYIPSTGEPLYLVRKDLGRARMESGLKEIVPLRSPKNIPEILAEYGYPMPTRVGMEFDVLPVALFNRFQAALDGSEMVDVSHLVRSVRAVKSDYELEIMKDAALLVDAMVKHAKEVIKVGMSDLELAAELECVARRKGHQGITRMRGFNSELFFGHIISGADSAAPAFVDAPLGGLGVNPSIGQGASYNRIAAQQPIVIDVIGAFDGYLVDQTRVLCIGGLPDQLRRAYDDMLRVQERLKEIARPGIAWGAIYDDCHAMAVEMGYADSFMGSKGAQVSFIGHGIGVEIDEYPFIARGFKDQLLEKKMTFAFEPKAVFPGLGAVGVENTFWVEDDGLKHLTFSDQELTIL